MAPELLGTDIGSAESSSYSPKELIMKYLPVLPWVIAFSILSLLVAGLSLRYAARIYNVSGLMLVIDPANGAGQQASIEKLLFSSPDKDINDEMVVIKSTSIARRVVDKLDLDIKYMNQGKIRSSHIRSLDCPFNLQIIQMNDSTSSFNLFVTIVNNQQFRLNEEEQVLMNFNQVFKNSNGIFRLVRTGADPGKFASNRFEVSYAHKELVARQLSEQINVTQLAESDNIIKLSLDTENPQLGEDIVNQWMKEYQASGLEEKREAAANTVTFIDDQLSSVQRDLGGVERNLLGLRERNRLINPEQQSEQLFTTVASLETEITQKGVELQIVDNLISYIADNRTPYRQVASTLGINEPSLGFQIAEFNKLQVERETLLKTTSRSNPAVEGIEASLEKLRVDIIQNLRNIRQALKLGYDNLVFRKSSINKEVAGMPAKERDLLDVTRRQKILEQLYSFLLQKKLETSIVSASSIPAVKVVEPAVSTDYPVKPNSAAKYLTALLIGIMVPLLFVFIKEYLNDKVRGRMDVIRATRTPIVGEVNNSKLKETLVVSASSRRFVAEQFRIIRTNLQYILPKQNRFVILMTSSTSGEGKSFITTNLGAATALAGKKTVILELDIRKPKIMSGLNMGKGHGITNFVIGTASYESVIQPVPGLPNFYVVPCGPVPPNPSELLLNERMDEFMSRIREDFEVVIIDTAPVGLVSDAVILSKYADMTLYVVRQNHTFKKQLVMLDELYRHERLPRMALVLNDVRVDGGYGKYFSYWGYGGEYGGYGYGFNSDYFEDAEKNEGIWQKIAGFFKPKGK